MNARGYWHHRGEAIAWMESAQRSSGAEPVPTSERAMFAVTHAVLALASIIEEVQHPPADNHAESGPFGAPKAT